MKLHVHHEYLIKFSEKNLKEIHLRYDNNNPINLSILNFVEILRHCA